MKLIPLTQGYSTIVDDEDFEELSKYKWYVMTNGKGDYIYASREHKTITMHRYIMRFSLGDKNVINHINGNTLDNRKQNLRIVSKSESQFYKKKRLNCTSKYKGVHWHRAANVWRSQITINNKNIYLGSFNYEIEAAISYNEAAKKYFGELAKLNEIKEIL